MIQIYDGFSADYTKNGIAVLFPISGTVTEQAGGTYELEMEYPLTDEKWRELVTGNILRVPVPATNTEAAQAGTAADIYRATEGGATLYSAQSVPRRVTYQQWNPVTRYSKGDKVTYNKNNWQYTAGATDRMMPPGSGNQWKRISNMSGNSSVVYTFTALEEFVRVQDMRNGWYKARTQSGIEGYVQAEQTEFYTVEELEPLPPKTIREQLFRIYETEIQTARSTIRVRARHVSYDLSGVLLGECDLNNRAPTVTISMVIGAMLQPMQTSIATNLTEDDGLYTGNLTDKNPVFALLDPDSGIVPYYQAKLVRDNWDFYIFRNVETNRGFSIEYGKNLKGVTWKRSTDSVITRVMPVAQDADGNPFYLEGEEPWVDSELIDVYPTIRMERLEVKQQVGGDDGDGGTWTEETLRAYMAEAAESRFTVDLADWTPYEIKVDFIRLGDTAEYRQYKDLEKIFLYDTVTIRHAPIGLDDRLTVTQYKWDFVNQHFSEITLSSGHDMGVLKGLKVAGFQLGSGAITTGKIQRRAITYELLQGTAVQQLKADAITATSAYIQHLIAEGITTDALYAAIATISKASLHDADIEWAEIENLTAEVAAITQAEIGSATIQTAQIENLDTAVATIAKASLNDADIEWADITHLTAAIASIADAHIAAADINFAQIKDAVIEQLITKDALSDRYYIRKLQVDNLQAISLDVNNLVVKAADGNYYALNVDSTGAVTATQRTVTASEIAAGVTSDGSRSIIETDLLVTDLAATNIKGVNALLDKIMADRINVNTLFAREAVIPQLEALDISGNQYLRLMVDGKLDDVAIGGRNYLRNSSDLDYSGYYLAGEYTRYDPYIDYGGIDYAILED